MLSIALAIIASGTINRESVLTICRNAVSYSAKTQKNRALDSATTPLFLTDSSRFLPYARLAPHDLPGHCQLLKVLFTTGYARNAIVHDGRLDPGVQLITKPFTYAALASKGCRA